MAAWLSPETAVFNLLGPIGIASIKKRLGLRIFFFRILLNVGQGTGGVQSTSA
jgi:hypothetical protein